MTYLGRRGRGEEKGRAREGGEEGTKREKSEERNRKERRRGQGGGEEKEGKKRKVFFVKKGMDGGSRGRMCSRERGEKKKHPWRNPPKTQRPKRPLPPSPALAAGENSRSPPFL